MIEYTMNSNQMGYHHDKVEVDNLYTKTICTDSIYSGSMNTGYHNSNFIKTNSIMVDNIDCGNIKINGLNGTIVYTDSNKVEHVFDLVAQAKLIKVITELKDSHPEALVDLILKGII